MRQKKYLLCRPDAGLNDILCQIERMHRYAAQTNRVLIVDTAYPNSITFKDTFSNYFESKEKNIILDIRSIEESLDDMSVFPNELYGRVNSYYISASDECDNIIDLDTGVQLSFDVSKDYPHQLLVHHACGGGVVSLFALTKLVLNQNLVDLLAARLDAIGGPYSAIHIRNTDYKTYYISALERIKATVIFPLFVATDNLECRNYCINLFGRDNVKYFTDLPPGGEALHFDYSVKSIYERNQDAILDLLTLAMATKFHRISRDGTMHGRINGYAALAENLITYDGILLSLFGENTNGLSILRHAIEWRKNVR